MNIVRRASSSPFAEVRDRLRSFIPRCVPFLIAVTAAWPALAEQVTKTVTYNGAKMEMIGTDDAIIEIKDETGKIFVRGKWDNETEEFAGYVLGTCPFQVRGTINYTGALMIFGQQPACDNEPAQWKTMRFIGPPEKIGSIVKPNEAKRHKPKRKLARSRAQRYSSWQSWQWQWR
jgi:hypothetical protein